jgi:hypothetical protein
VCGRRFSRKTISSLIDKEGYERGEKRRIEEICCLLSKNIYYFPMELIEGRT